MLRAEYLTKTAQDLNYGVLCPVALNLDTLEKLYQISNDYLAMPMIIRVNAGHFDLGDYAHFAYEFEKKYPQSECSIMAVHITTYEEAVEACRYNYKGVAIRDSLCIDDEANWEFIAKVGRVCKASDCSLQVTAKDPQVLFDQKVQSFMITNGVGIVRINLKEEVNDANIEDYKALLKKLKENVPVSICINDMSNVDLKYYEAFKWNGCCKFDVFAKVAEDGAKAVIELSNKNSDKTNRALLPAIKKNLFETYLDNLLKYAVGCGNFVSRHAATKPDALK